MAHRACQGRAAVQRRVVTGGAGMWPEMTPMTRVPCVWRLDPAVPRLPLDGSAIVGDNEAVTPTKGVARREYREAHQHTGAA